MGQKLLVLVSACAVSALMMNSAYAFDDFNGKIESRPDGRNGEWVIGGRTLYVTDKTNLDESDGALEVGACVEVDISQGWVTEIERDADWRCRD